MVSILMTMMSMAVMRNAPADDLWRVLSGGKPDLHLRYRFENVDDGQQPRLADAYANTLQRARLQHRALPWLRTVWPTRGRTRAR